MFFLRTVGRAQSDGSIQVFTYGPAEPGASRWLPRLVFFSQRGIQLGLVQHRNSLEEVKVKRRRSKLSRGKVSLSLSLSQSDSNVFK